MRFLQIVTAIRTDVPRPAPSPEQRVRTRDAIQEQIASGALLATGGLGKRATSAARIVYKAGQFTIEDPPTGEGWMAGGGYSLNEYPTKEEAIANAKGRLEIMGDGMIELIQVSEIHPPPRAAAAASSPAGVVPYLTLEGAAEAVAFYQRAFGAKEIARMLAEDGKRLMHCQLEINGGPFMLADHFSEFGGAAVQRSASDTMQLIVADGDAWWKRAAAAGCKEKLPFAVAPWGDRYGQLLDPFGVTWAINSPSQS
jgi:PhnB protein